ncbi:T9SS type A sorting domain-containing protein [Balneola sp. MJW-20]|uniref:T9SS-dependent M6-like inactivated metalloprotease n=1 Tax=Gracilimonas aurantiaca TaxID=3234185 RepID=UPI0034B5928A
MLILSMLFVFGKQDISAFQVQVKRSHAISLPDLSSSQVPTTGTLNVVAIMVEFQPDSNRFTSGTGIFGPGGLPYLERATDFRVEPLPHDQSYFEAHLEFAKNYYEQASDGQLSLNYRVLPDVYRLDQPMENYSPTGEFFTTEKLAELVRDSWAKVEESGGFDATGLNPEETAFIIFHAGVGRDIQLTGTSLDVTPQDIPSIYLKKDQIGRLLGEQSFEGFEINGGTFRITNSMILPRTESRRGLDIQQNEFVFPLSINGLLCASIGSHLGLPDLFNTETGEPAIGRFGLMDGSGFFAYNGLLPPEPTAWSKTFLSWQEPTEADITSISDLTVEAASLISSDNIIKIPLSSSEYFLIENRHRDPDSTGITLTIRNSDGQESQQTFTNFDNAFVFQEPGFDSLLNAGVIVDADNFDFSLPGGLDIGNDGIEGSADDRILNGGILIWHIDEGIIDAQLSSGRVNTDPERRGVDVEEADGSQDIGPGIPGAIDNSAAFGSPYDFWWSGNNFRVITQFGDIQIYENRFGPDTRPNNASNSGSPSFFELTDFSDNQASASFRLSAIDIDQLLYEPSLSLDLNGNDFATPADAYWDSYPLSLSFYTSGADSFLVLPSQTTVSVLAQGSPSADTLTELFPQQPLILDRIYTASNPVLPDQNNDQINIRAFSWNQLNTEFDQDFEFNAAANNGFISSFSGDTLFIENTTDVITLADDTYLQNERNRAEQRSSVINGLRASSAAGGVAIGSELFYEINSGLSYRAYTGSFQLGNRALFYILTDRSLIIADPESDDPFTLLYEQEQSGWPAFSSEGRIYVINKSSNQLEGYNPSGGQLIYTPIQAPTNVQFTGTPLIADINNDLEPDILVTGQDSASLNIYAYDTQGNPFEGFPLYVGRAAEDHENLIHPVIVDQTLYAISKDGSLKGWTFKDIGEVLWPSIYGEAVFSGNVVSSISDRNENGNGSAFGVLNKAETYNWPNPADQETHVRFELDAPGSVTITVADMSGRIIFEQKTEHNGGFPEEITVNTTDWANGPYFCLVKANSEGRSDSKLIKIAIVH